jgi:transcriptional regulator GlxA family with amidase domain
MSPPKIITILAPPGVQLTDVSGPLDVFAEANAQAGHVAYRLEVVGTTPGPVRSSSGIRLLEAADHVPKQVAVRCGFADVNVLRRAFRRHLGITPSEYRKQFRRTALPTPLV